MTRSKIDMSQPDKLNPLFLGDGLSTDHIHPSSSRNSGPGWNILLADTLHRDSLVLLVRVGLADIHIDCRGYHHRHNKIPDSVHSSLHHRHSLREEDILLLLGFHHVEEAVVLGSTLWSLMPEEPSQPASWEGPQQRH